MDIEIKELLGKNEYTFDDLVTVMKLLRSENGCPWDREQTHDSIRKNFIEETYEVVDAIDSKDTDALKEELGDVLLQVVFHARMEEELGSFGIKDVCTDICRKLIIRHPHIFSTVIAEDSDTVLKNWDEIKNQTKGIKKQSESLMAVPTALPSLMRAQKVQSRAAKVDFDFSNAEEAVTKLYEELSELKIAMKKSSNAEEEIGDVLFSAVNIARLSGYDAEEALFKANEKFIARFKKMEELAEKRNIILKDADMADKDKLWEEAKKSL